MKTTTHSGRPQHIVLLAPRHGGPVPSRLVLKMARTLAKKRGKTLVTSHSRKTEAEMESSSDWNSLLLTARAQRGPQWDVVTQQFMVDHNSRVYYDSTPLLATRKEKEKERVRAVAGQQVQARQDAAQFTVASQMHQNQPQHQSIMLEAAGSYRDLLQTTYPYANGNIPASPAGTTGNGYGSDTPYIPPEALRNPRRTTRGLNGREGMYRV